MDNPTVAAPGECHPAYADRPGVVDWVTRGGHPTMNVTFAPAMRIQWAATDGMEPIGPAFKTHTITRKQASGPAPWVGTPYVYLWWVGVDELGRQVASDSWRAATPMDELMFGPLKCDDRWQSK